MVKIWNLNFGLSMKNKCIYCGSNNIKTYHYDHNPYEHNKIHIKCLDCNRIQPIHNIQSKYIQIKITVCTNNINIPYTKTYPYFNCTIQLNEYPFNFLDELKIYDDVIYLDHQCYQIHQLPFTLKWNHIDEYKQYVNYKAEISLK